MSEQLTTGRPGKQEHRGNIRRLDAVLGGPVWWACHLGGGYWLIPRMCELGATWPYHLLTVAMVALIARAWLSGWQLLRAGRDATDEPGASRDVFLGWTGMSFSLFFGAVTIAEWTPVLFLDPCW